MTDGQIYSSRGAASHDQQCAAPVGVAARLRGVKGDLGRYLPFPMLQDRAHWEKVLRHSGKDLIARGKARLKEDWPDLPEELYRDFDRSNNRDRFETIYFARRQMLNDLVLAELAEANGRFIAHIGKGIATLCAEAGWQLPAHNRYVREGTIHPLPDPKRPVVDLFAAQTASQLATLSAVLGAALPQADHDVIANNIESRVLSPYLDYPFWWTGRVGGRLNNWTTWCTSSILYAAFQSDRLTAAQRGVIAGHAADSLDLFLDDYGDDGACPEGPNYYRHAALCLFAALDCLNHASGAHLAPLLTHPKLRNMAEFPLYVHMAGDRFANFGDGDSKSRGATAQMFAAGKLCQSASLCDFAADQHARFPTETAGYDFCLRNRLTEFALADEITHGQPASPTTKEGYLPSLGMLTARRGGTALAVKAGINQDSHTHNDTGSFIVHHGATPVLIDVGVENYTRKTFSPERYDIWTMQSPYHNLADFEGAQQVNGLEYTARDVSYRITEDSAFFEAELAGTYGADAGLRSYRRTVELASDGTVTASDRYDGSRAGTLNLMTCLRPVIDQGRIMIGADASLDCATAARASIEVIPVTDSRLRQSWPDKIYRLRIPFDDRQITIKISKCSTEGPIEND
ncbi:heparinase II/III domain-containing protein [Litoreibacter albidus]|uniref:Heparinase II/III-like protein n=1 Tax=Litoreibacter albidus TaxID=670155 RepID=A0A1H3CJC3_9RHOB|nr:heparinase II/III family protein [Litoreibacter albidus]SDX54100.1 Heparinase II/III-like protein [Litoreibacter albidus]